MKKLLLAMIAVGLSACSFAQTDFPYIKRPTLAVNFYLKDMYTPTLIDQNSLSNVLSNKQWTKIADMSPSIGLSYYQGLTSHIDFVGSLGGSPTKYPFSASSGVTSTGTYNFFT